MKNIEKIFGAGIVWILLLSGMSGVSACTLDTELIAGQDTTVGNVHVLHGHSVDNYMTITYETTDGWMLTETNVAVATSFAGIPQTNPNKPEKIHNPKVGKFQYSDPHPPVTTYTYTINLDDYITPTGDLYKGTLYVAAHAVVEHPDYGEETAWADTYGIPFNEDGKGNWALYFIVVLY
jgi:hypothetical protein